MVKGKHYCLPYHLNITIKTGLKGKFKFGDSCLYTFNNIDKYDINKLIGLSDNFFHHKDSVRIGWRCIDSKSIEILSYIYNNGIRVEEKLLCITEPNKYIKFDIRILDGKYIIKINDIDFTFKRTSKWGFIRYLLFPYFGGNLTPPHDMFIKLKYKKV